MKYRDKKNHFKCVNSSEICNSCIFYMENVCIFDRLIYGNQYLHQLKNELTEEDFKDLIMSDIEELE